MKESNKDSLRRDSRLRRIGSHLREHAPRQGRIVYRQMLRGAAGGVGSGAVSLLIVWWQSRH